ncbi:MAG TPA: site-2 protease family protein [Acidimicrobiales bacterium]|nr:site-2 protease family protein [Acidimicrobiales bacterium]
MSLLHPDLRGNGPGFRLAGIPIQVQWTFVLFMVLFGAALEDPALIAAWVVLAAVSILVHELGHAVAFRLWDVESRIVLHPMGGVTIPTRGDLPGRWSSVVVSLAGPVAGMVLLGLQAILLLEGRAGDDPWHDVLALAVWVNVVWSVVNLLPILPLDGGNVVLAGLDALTGGRGMVPARWLSIGVAVGVGAFALSQDLLFGAVYAGFFVFDNLRGLRAGREREAAGDLQPAAKALDEGDVGRALELGDAVLGRSRDPRVRALALEVTAWAALTSGDRADARRRLALFPTGIEPSGHLRAFVEDHDPAEQVNLSVDAWLDGRYVPARTYLDHLAEAGLLGAVVDRVLASRADDAEAARMGLQHALFLGGRFDESARVGEAMMAAGTTEPVVAFNTACAHARAGRRDAALEALATAVDLGFRDMTMLEQDPDLAAVRADPRFAMLRNRVG